MNAWRIILGFTVSMFGGALVTLVGKRIALAGLKQEMKYRTLVIPLGIIERFLYTGVFLIGPLAWIPIWLAMKTAVGWLREPEKFVGHHNLYLMGNALSLICSYIGAWIALGQLPLVK